MKLSIYYLTSHIRHKGTWNADAIWGLVVFEDGSHDAREGKGRAVESVTELNLLVVGMTITTLKTVGLIGVEIAYGRHFEPTALSFRIYLEVIADGRGERLVATAKQQYALTNGQLILTKQMLARVKQFHFLK